VYFSVKQFVYFKFFTVSFLEARNKLTKATYKSEFSSTEDEMVNMRHRKKIKCPSLSPNATKYIKTAKDQCKPHLSDSCPPRFIPVKGIFI